jgi:hypothetical protein
VNTLASPIKKNPKKPRRKRWFLGFLIFSMTAAFLLIESRLILDEPESKMDDPTLQADCGVVLTGSSGRIREAFEILAQKRIKKLIVSGVFKEAQLNEIFPRNFRSRYLLRKKISHHVRKCYSKFSFGRGLTLSRYRACNFANPYVPGSSHLYSYISANDLNKKDVGTKQKRFYFF